MLEGLKVIELATYIAAPSVAGVMADWGAEVIKIEAPGGDPARRGMDSMMPPGSANPIFELDNRGKRSIVLDIGKPEGREALVRMIREADVFITNLRPGGLARARLDYESLKTENPRLIYASVTGFGLQGDEADRPGFDVAAFWARSGVAALMTPVGVDPFPIRTGMGDHVCGLATGFAIMTAVYERSVTGRGRLVETSLLRAGLYAVGGDMSIQLRFGRVASTRVRTASFVPLVNFFRSQEGHWFCVMPRKRDLDWPKIANAAGRGDLLADSRFDTDRGRRDHVADLVLALDEGFGRLAFEDIAARLTAADLVWSQVQTPAQVMVDPQAIAAGCFVETPDGEGGAFQAPASPARFPGADDGPKGPAPALGQHTDGILAEFGFDELQIASMRRDGVAA